MADTGAGDACWYSHIFSWECDAGMWIYIVCWTDTQIVVDNGSAHIRQTYARHETDKQIKSCRELDQLHGIMVYPKLFTCYKGVSSWFNHSVDVGATVVDRDWSALDWEALAWGSSWKCSERQKRSFSSSWTLTPIRRALFVGSTPHCRPQRVRADVGDDRLLL